MSVGRIEDHGRRVSWTKTFEALIGIGHYNCDWCGKETPAPTDAQLIKYAQEYPGQNFMWPNEGTWEPPGWIDVGNEFICDDCAASVRREKDRRRG